MDTAYRFSSKHLKAIRFRHKSTFHPTVPTCQECQQSWSCDTDDVLARIVGLERQLAEAQATIARLAEAHVKRFDKAADRILSKEKE